MSLFAHHPTTPDSVLASVGPLTSAASAFDGIGTAMTGRTTTASAQTYGVLSSPILGLDQPVVNSVAPISAAATLTTRALGDLASAITTYNSGVDDLNKIYDEAKAANFYVEAIPADQTGSDGEKLSAGERQELFDDKVAKAKSQLEATLRTREAVLRAALETEESGIAATLTAGCIPGLPGLPGFPGVPGTPGVPGLPFPWPFGGPSSSGSESEEEEEDDGGLLGGVTDTLSDIGGGIRDFGSEVWDRTSTFGVYTWDTTVRRVTNPTQTLYDTFTGTALLEDVAAAEAILGEDGELDRDNPYADDAAFITGVSVPDGADAITLGHTIRVSGEEGPTPDLSEHEMQHVYDIEDAGGLGFYATYGVDYLKNRYLEGKSHDEAYRDIYWEQRGYDVGDDPDKEPEGIGGPVSDVIDTVDGAWQDLFD